MRNICYFLFGSLFFMLIIGCREQASKWPVSDFKFEGMLGHRPDDMNTLYLLQGTGFFLAPRSENSDSLVAAWISSHPHAFVHPISQVEGDDKNGMNLFFCWLIDQKDTLNNYLVKAGACPGGTMIRPKTWTEMVLEEREMYEDEKYHVSVFVEDQAYDQFIEQIRAAEQYAHSNKLGIWNK